ncbi:glycosyltransferase [candidate division WOR-3 bacterium]|nr:glycosyltransferase [candidate division WOR-3 bacterium]
MTRTLEDYRSIVGDHVVSEIHRRASRLYSKHVLHVNSAYQGGGVAEMLAPLVHLLNDIGVPTGWRILHGSPDFFMITKKFHNALQGDPVNLSPVKQRLYAEANERFSFFTHIDHDCVIIHDPQPMPMISYYRKRQPWVWRCHMDLSHPNPELWSFLKRYILKYDRVVVSDESYHQPDLPIEQVVIRPAIDPLSAKNAELPEAVLTKALRKFEVPLDKPLITQVSRFDKWKDPLGVIEAFRLVKDQVDCRLVLCGSMASDDPEGQLIYERVRRQVNSQNSRRDIILIAAENSTLVNALQRNSAVVVQKSLREGFGLTVTEALWKSRPVVATRVGGIPIQIDDGVNGFLVEPADIRSCADRIVRLLKDRKLAEDLGRKGREKVRDNFLITRLLLDHLRLYEELLGTVRG